MEEGRVPSPGPGAARAELTERTRVAAHDVSWSLRATHRASSAVDQALAQRIGLRQLDYTALTHVLDAEETPLGPAELGHRLGISAGSASELVDRLERAGHVSRAREDVDRRRISVVPQRAAVAQVLGHLAPLFAALDGVAESFSSEEQEVIIRYLRLAASELGDHAEALSNDPPADPGHHST